MCGICFICSSVIEDFSHKEDKPKRSYSCRHADEFSECTSLLHHRGPDASSSYEFLLPGNLAASMQGCVLHLRGELTPQPITNSKGNALLWNGEIFGGIEVREDENDTQVLFDLLDSCSCQESIVEVFRKLNGPWAVIFWQAETKTLWFGRDMFGRRSLLWHLPENADDTFLLSSVALDGKVYKEIPSVGIFCIDFSHLKTEENKTVSNVYPLPPIVLYPWLDCRWPGTSLHVQRTPTEDYVEFFYPNSPNCGANFIISENSINRWIPTMCTNSKIESEIPEDYAFFSYEQNYAVSCSPIPKSGFIETKRQDLKETHSVEEKELDGLLGNIWVERSDLHYLVQQCMEILQEAVNTRVKRQEQKKLESTDPSGDKSARVGVLFSGGLDSTILAALADRCLPAEEPIDLLNVAFEQPPIVEQPTGKQKKPRRHKKTSSNQSKCSKESCDADSPVPSCSLSNDMASSLSVSGHKACIREDVPAQFHSVQDTSSTVETTFELHHTSNVLDPFITNNIHGYVERSKSSSVSGSHRSCFPNPPLSQTETLAPSCNETCDVSCSSEAKCSLTISQSQQEPLSVLSSNSCATEKLFSGPSTFDPFDVPDRRTGRLALSELNPLRKWNFVEINVTQAELQSVRQSHISKLIYPLRTVLDDSIGCAVWFAARGKGVISSGIAENRHQEIKDFQSHAQVLLCGMAADELFAGYSRHRATFNKEGWLGLEKEIQGELWRISARNLGRDDRIIADHGKEARFPYLDENFVQLVSKIPLHKRVDLHYPRGIGEKLLLRLCAHSLGLVKTACQAKRAIQFGSKIAKLDKKKEKGSDVCDRLL